MRVQGIPSGTIDGGSARMRYFRRQKYMPADIVWSEYEDSLDCDLLYIQKRANKIDVIKEAKQRGIPVVYDTDDGNGVRRKGNDLPIFPLVDAITTDSEQRARVFRKITDTPVHVVPDGIDYLEGPPVPTTINKAITKICTFGSHRSVKASVNYLLQLQGAYQVTYITSRKIAKLKKCKFKEWNYGKLVRQLQKHDLCILVHEDADEKKWKGNARLLVAMAAGIPTITSNTPAYRDVLVSCGTTGLTVSGPEEVLTKILLLNSNHTRGFIQSQFTNYVWKHHHPKVSALMLANIFKGLRNATNTDVQ